MLNHVSLPLWDHQLHNYINSNIENEEMIVAVNAIYAIA